MNNSQTFIKKRILYVENGIGYGGAIICLRHLVRNLDRSVYEPFVVTGRTGPEYESIAGEASWKYICDTPIDCKSIKERIDNSILFKKLPGFNWICRQIISRADDFINFLPFFLRLLKLVMTFKPYLIHANNEPLCNRAAILAGKVTNTPVVCHVRGDQRGSAMMKWLYQLPDHFITVSRWVSESIGYLGVPASKRTVVYDGISFYAMDFNAPGEDFRKAFNIGSDDFAVGLVGLLIPWKGQDIFLDAAKMLKDKIPTLRMVVVGGTPDECTGYEADLKKRVEKENLGDIVIFTGHRTDMESIYNGLDVVVSASTSPEPLGTMIIECMAMARPLIAPNHGGAAEMTEHNKTALLFQPGSGKDLSEAVLELFQNKEKREIVGKNARDKAFSAFSVAEHVKNVEAVYKIVKE